MISYHDFLLKCLSLVIRLNYESHIFTIPKFIDSTTAILLSLSFEDEFEYDRRFDD